MKKIGLCVVLLLSCSCHQNADISHAVREQRKLSRLMEAYLKPGEPYTQGRLHLASGFEFQGPMTIEQFRQVVWEKEKEITGKDLPLGLPDFIRVTNDRWLRRRGLSYKPGDRFYFFRTDERSWHDLVGSEGYLLLRKGKILDVLVTVAQ